MKLKLFGVMLFIFVISVLLGCKFFGVNLMKMSLLGIELVISFYVNGFFIDLWVDE